jgi:hypothetical protein
MEPANWPAPLFSTNYFFLAAFFLAPPFFFADFLAPPFFFMAMVRSPELEWNTRSIPRWTGGWATARRSMRPIRYALIPRARRSDVSNLLAIRRLMFVVRYA